MTWVAFDTETTGLEPGSRLVELAAIAFDDKGTVIDTFASIVNPGMPIPADATAVHGLDDAAVALSPNAATALNQFWKWLPDGAVLVGHNSRYDQGIISWECQRASVSVPDITVVDTVPMARMRRDTLDCSLGTLVAHHNLKPCGKAHRAMADADSVRQYFQITQRTICPVAKPWYAPYACPTILPTCIANLADLITSGLPFKFHYCGQSGRASNPSIIPYGWARTSNGAIQFHGLSTWNPRRLTFRADRVKTQVNCPMGKDNIP